ncbi:MAG: hypothetical protein P8L77_00320, partial [Gammaproteobacteria bacterium]|nr:hypothetical protein [Gammaproteobacteria bacterium]
MPDRAQINRYIINHGVKDQLLAMFDQTLKSNRFFSKTYDQADPWYVKSLIDLTYLIRHMVSDAVKEHMTLLSPLETKRVVDQEIVKLYWHFFSAQQTAYDNINERYKGIERLKTISFIINKANFCIKNPNNINANLKLVGFDDWGDSFLTLNSSTESLVLLQEELDHLLTFKASLSDALKETKAFRAEQKIIEDKGDLSKTFAQKLSKGLKVKSLLDELDEKIDALEKSIEDHRSVATNKISSELKDMSHTRLDKGEDDHLISDSDEEYEYGYDHYDVKDIDATKVDPRLKMLLDISAYGVYRSDSSNIEHQLLTLLEGAFGFKLIDLHVENFNELNPLLIDALETSNLSKIEMYLANVYPKKLSLQNYTNLHPELVKSMLWPSVIKKDSSQVSLFDEVLSFFNEGSKFKRSREASDFVLSKLIKRKEMTHFYHFYAQKMCSFTPELSGFPEQSYKSIRLEKVDKRFKACTADLVFKFASLAEVLKCDQLSKEEIEDLGVQVEKTIIFLNRTGQVNPYDNSIGQVNPYDFIAKWSLKRFHRLNNKTTDFVKDKKQLDMFLALYASDFECVDSQFMNFFQADEVSEAKHSKTRQKLDLIGGFDNLANKSQMMEIVNLFGMQNKHEPSSRLNYFLDQIYIDQKCEETSNELKIKNVKNIMEQCYKTSQSLTDNSKMFLSRYALLAYKFSHKSKYTSHQDALVTQFIKLNERIFNKPIYQFSDKLISNLSGFIKNNNINYKGWQALLRGSQISNDGGRYIDIFTLFEIQSQESETLAAAIGNTLNWIESSCHQKGGLAQLTYVEKNIKNYSDRYGLLIEEAKQIEQVSFKSPKPARIFPLSRAIVAENHSSDFKRSNELGQDVINLLGKLAKEMDLSLSLNLVKLLESKSYDAILDRGLLPSVKKMFHDHAKSSVSDAVKNMSESERLLKEVGYESDFSDESIEDLPSYHVFFNAMLPHFKEKHLLDLLSADETKKFSPKTLRDALVLKEKSLMKSIEKQQKIVNDAKSKNRVASDLENELRLIFLAFDAVSNERSVENINLAEAISISGVTPDVDRAMMIRLMPSLKEVDLINESSLSSVISILKLAEKIKSVGLNEKDEILSQLGKEGYDKGAVLQQRLFDQFSQMKKNYHGIDKYNGNVSEVDLRDEFFVFIDAVKVLRENSVEDQEIFVKTAKEGLFRLPLTDLLDAIDDDAVIHLVKTLGQSSREANEVRNSLGKEKLASLYNALYANTDGFVDVDLNSEEDITVSEKTLFFLSQHYPDIYDDLIKKYLYKNVRYMTHLLEIVYLDCLLEKADVNLNQAKQAHDPSRMSTETTLVAATQKKAMLDSVKNFCINGSSEMFFTTLSYLLPKNDNRKLLDQLIYQFAPSWGYELSIDRNKEIIDMSLSTQL